MPDPLARIIIFTSNLNAMTRFYRDVLGLPELTANDDGRDTWRQFDAGPCAIALHAAPDGVDTSNNNGQTNPVKISFHCANIAAERKRLISHGIDMGPHHRFGDLELCDGPDPDGNRFQLSSR